MTIKNVEITRESELEMPEGGNLILKASGWNKLLIPLPEQAKVRSEFITFYPTCLLISSSLWILNNARNFNFPFHTKPIVSLQVRCYRLRKSGSFV